MKTMQMREFLRGGYRTITEPTLVSSHNRIVFTVMPHTEKAFLRMMIDQTGPKPVSRDKNA